jgi:spore coat protein CotH
MNYRFLINIIFAAISFTSCEKYEGDVSDINNQISIETPDWSEVTHGSNTEPNYSMVFPQDAVQRIDIEISSSDWNAILSDLGTNLRLGPGNQFNESYTPIWVPCEVHFNGIEWYKVGIRVKGNSSLRTTYQSGIKKFSFKLDFDQFEDTYPDIKDQRFYGFKQLNLNNNFEDQSELREKIASDLFREFGVPSANTAFYEVYVTIDGVEQYFGLYTMVEEVDNTVIKTQFSDYSGNLYKPEGIGATFEYGSFNTADFYKKTNEEAADWTDVKELYNALHSSLRTTNPTEWHSLMESKMNMELYLKWLAANTVMQNWDTYGIMTHNYYLYNDPTTSKFVWIPWDNNEALQEGKQGGAISIDLSDVDDQWPFISFIASDHNYYATYKEFAKEFVSTVFEPSKMATTYDYYSNLIRESVLKEEAGYTFLRSSSEFSAAIDQLKTHASDRYSVVTLF